MRAQELAAAIGGRLLGDDVVVEKLARIDVATAMDMSIVLWPHDIRAAKKSRASLLLVSQEHAADHADALSASLIVVEDLAVAIFALKQLDDERVKHDHRNSRSFIATTAAIHPSAIIGASSIGERVRIGPHVVIGADCSIGDGSVIESGVVIHDKTVIGSNVHIGANSVIGSSGFVPFGLDESMCLPCFGCVHIADRVRIGALCSIDRGFLGATRVGAGTSIDNMVHIAHDAVIKENVIIAAQSGLAGFVCVDDNVTIGGQAGIAPFVVVGAGARISGKSFIHCDIKNFEIWSGNPSVPHALYLRAYGKLKRSFKDSAR